MNTLDIKLHNLLVKDILDEDFQTFVDNYNEKYDAVEIDGFEKAPLSINYTFAQVQAQTGATALPAYVDPESPAYEMALKEIQGQTGNIPTMKAFYRLNRVRLLEQMQLIQRLGGVDSRVRDIFLGLYDESTEGLIKAYYNALTHQRMQVVSTGKFIINDTNNPRGLKGITLDFGVEKKTLADAKKWFTNLAEGTANEDADPIKDIREAVDYIQEKKHYFGGLTLEMSKTLFRALVMHPSVRKAVALYKMPISTVETALSNIAYVGDDVMKAGIEALAGITIKVRDTYAFVLAPDKQKKDLVETQIDNFDKFNIAFVPAGTIGSIQGVQPLTLGYDPADIAEFDGGRLILSQRAIPETHSIYIESEAAQLCVPSQAQNMYIMTVAK